MNDSNSTLLKSSVSQIQNVESAKPPVCALTLTEKLSPAVSGDPGRVAKAVPVEKAEPRLPSHVGRGWSVTTATSASLLIICPS